MRDLTNAIGDLGKHGGQWHRRPVLSFVDFLQEVIKHPEQLIRDVYQVYTDMITAYICDGVEEYGDDPDAIGFLEYDCTRLFVEDSDRAFFADRLFANRLMRHVESFKVGGKQNKIFIFDGPHGSGKSTFLNNLLRKFEQYANSPEGFRYEVVWKLKYDRLAGGVHSLGSLTDKLAWVLESEGSKKKVPGLTEGNNKKDFGSSFDVPCPSHDHPLLLIPKDVRRIFFDDLFEDDEIKWRLFTGKNYEWLFQDEPCTICSSIYQELLKKYQDPARILDFIFARPYVYNRRLGEGISVFNPGDKPLRRNVMTDEMVQRKLNSMMAGAMRVSYLYSRYAKTNNGIYALMDIKSQNTDRLMELHNIISDGVHKVEDIEERVNSLLFALMNPEDKKLLKDLHAFADRVEYINIPYVLDLKTEVDIYREKFGKHIDESFLPRVLHNFARVIIATRLKTKSEAMEGWIGNPEKYEMYCDKHLQLLKMELFTGYIPKWLLEEDVKSFNAERRRKIIAESERDGWQGLSGRDSIKMFNDFYTTYARDDKLIEMSMLGKFFRKFCKKDKDVLPMGFLDSLLKMYNYTVLQEVKESLYYYNEEQISRNIVNYIFAVNFEDGDVELCEFTGEKIDITEDFFRRVELQLQVEPKDAPAFRANTQKSYTATALTQEILRDGLEITETTLYMHLYDKYVYNLKEKVLEPFLKNENFRRAVKDFNMENFKTYDKKIQDDVTYMIENLQKKYLYSRQGANEICIYVIDNNLAEEFSAGA